MWHCTYSSNKNVSAVDQKSCVKKSHACECSTAWAILSKGKCSHKTYSYNHTPPSTYIQRTNLSHRFKLCRHDFRMKEKVNKGRKKKRPLYECPNQGVNNNSLCMTGYKTDSTHKSILKNSLGMRLHTHTCTTFFPPHWLHHTSIPPHDHHILHSHHSSSIPFYLWVDPPVDKMGQPLYGMCLV